MSRKNVFYFVYSIILLAFFVVGCSSDDNISDGDNDIINDGDSEMNEEDSTEEENTTDGDNEQTTDGDIDEITDGDEEDEQQTSVCHTDIQVGEVQIFVDGLSGTEGIAFDGIDKMYVTNGTKLLTFDSNAEQTLVAELPRSIGVAMDKDGNAMLCGWGEKDDETRDGGIFKVTPEGEVSTISEGVIANANFITRTPWGTWLVSDDMIPEIWEMDDSGNETLWSEAIPSPNGMVFSRDGSKLYVAGTFEDDGPLYEITITEDNKAGDVKKLATFGNSWNDGLAMDENGVVYLLANLAGKIYKIQPDGTSEEFVSNVNFAASAAFGEGEGFDPCSIYVTSLLGDQIWRIGTGVEGQPLYK